MKVRKSLYIDKEVIKKAQINAINENYNSFSKYVEDILKKIFY